MCCCGTNCVPLVNNCRSVCLCREACLYVAGFPCTPFSVLHGGSKLLGDKNAGQLYEVIRRLKRLCPAASCHSLSRFEYISSFERNTGNAQSLFEISRLAYWKTWLALCGSLLRSWRSCNIISQSNLVCLWQWHTILMITTLVTTLTLRYEITWQFIDPSLGIHLFPCWCNNCFPPCHSHVLIPAWGIAIPAWGMTMEAPSLAEGFTSCWSSAIWWSRLPEKTLKPSLLQSCNRCSWNGRPAGFFGYTRYHPSHCSIHPW